MIQHWALVADSEPFSGTDGSLQSMIKESTLLAFSSTFSSTCSCLDYLQMVTTHRYLVSTRIYIYIYISTEFPCFYQTYIFDLFWRRMSDQSPLEIVLDEQSYSNLNLAWDHFCDKNLWHYQQSLRHYCWSLWHYRRYPVLEFTCHWRKNNFGTDLHNLSASTARFEISTHTSMISNSVTHLWSYTNSAIAGTPRRYRRILRASADVSASSADIVASNGEDTSVLWFFTMFWEGFTMFYDVSRCITMFYKCFMMFFYV